MITSISAFNIGQTFPINSEKERIEGYYTYKELYEGEHTSVYEEAFKRIQRIVGSYHQVVSYATIINYQKLISLKTADLLLGEPPKIKVEDTVQQAYIDGLIENGLLTTAYEIAIDTSRFGTGLFYLSKLDKSDISCTQPCYYYPIVNKFNCKKVEAIVLATTYTEVTPSWGGSKKQEFLQLEIHTKGAVESRVHMIKDGKIDAIVQEPIVVKTGIDDFLVIDVQNCPTSDTIYGTSDYDDVDSLISEILVRISQINKILDKHSDPNIILPSSCLTQDPETGEYKVKSGGNAFVVESREEMKPEYMTWNAQLEFNFKQIELLLNQLYIISQMGSVILGSSEEKLGNISGSALKRMAMSAVAKVSRVKNSFDTALKRVIKNCAKMDGLNINNISITWEDGIPNDLMEMAQIANLRTGNKQTMSIESAIKWLDSNDSPEDELAKIQEDSVIINPTFGGGTDDTQI